MSLATQLTGVLGRSFHASAMTGGMTTSEFCRLLETAVAYMQTAHPIHDLDQVLHVHGGVFVTFLDLVRRSVRAGRFYMLACVVMLFYDYIVTLDLEVEQVWKRRKSIVDFLFYINRYLPLGIYLFVICGVFSSSTNHQFCIGVFARLPPIMVVTSEVVIGLLRITKVRALWRNELNKWFCWGVIAIFLVQTALAIACAVAVQGVGPLFSVQHRIGCFLIFHSGSMPRLVLHWFTNLVFNILIYCCIIRKALSVRKAGGDETVANFLVREAVLFLAVLSVVKIGNLIMLFVFPYWNAVNWAFNHMADVILTSRLIFNLRAVVSGPPEDDDVGGAVDASGDEYQRSLCKLPASSGSYDLEAVPYLLKQDTGDSSVICIGPAEDKIAS